MPKDPTVTPENNPAKSGVSEVTPLEKEPTPGFHEMTSVEKLRELKKHQPKQLDEREEKRKRLIEKRNAQLAVESLGESSTGDMPQGPVEELSAAPESKTDLPDQNKVANETELGETSPELEVEDDSPPAIEKEAVEEVSDEKGSTPYYLKDGVPTVTLKVNGETIEMPLDKVKGIAQRNILAENRLRQVSTAEKNLKSREAIIAQRESQLDKQRASTTTHPPSQGVESQETDIGPIIKETADVLFDGDKQEAQAILRKFADAIKSTAPFDAASLVAEATKKATDAATSVVQAERAAQQQEKYRIDLKKGLAAVTAEFPEVMQDDVLFSMVDRRTQDLAEIHTDWSIPEVMMAAAKEVSDRVGNKVKNVDTTPASSPERKARKQGLQIVPPQAAGGRAPIIPKTEEIDTSPQAVLARMREQRGAIAGRS